MSKSAFAEMAEKDMDFEAKWVIKDICDYADKNIIEYDFIFDTFLKAFNKRLRRKVRRKSVNSISRTTI